MKKVKSYSIQDFMNNTAYIGASFSPDNSKILVSSNQTGIFNACAISLKGGEPIPLTHATVNSIFTNGYFPHDERFLYSGDDGGNEQIHVYVRELDGSIRDLTPGKRVKAEFLNWAPDGLSFYIGTNAREPRYFDVYEYKTDSYERTLIYQNDNGLDFVAISPDRRYIALAKTLTNADSDVYLLDRETGSTRLLTATPGEISCRAYMFSRDSRDLYLSTDQDSEFQYLTRCSLSGGQMTPAMQTDWDVWSVYLSKKGKYLAIGVNNDARTELRLYETAGMKRVELPPIPDGADISSVVFSADESLMAFYAGSSCSPQDLFVWDFSGQAPRKLTRALNPDIDPDDLVEGQVVRFKSFDGLEIPGILYKPHQADTAAKAPALVKVHGGPGGQARLEYNGLTQYLVNRGYVVFSINNRGSSGYGKTFYHLDDRKHGEGDLDDCVTSRQMLTATGYVDADRIGIIGGSYGGYMTLAALAFRPTAFKVGVDIFGVSNWVRTLQNIPVWWESYRASLEMEMGDFNDTDYLKSISPLFHADKIVRPLIVLQGANDPRVLQAESDEIVAAVRQNNVPVEYIVFADEGHGFVKKDNQIMGYEAILKFLDAHLK